MGAGGGGRNGAKGAGGMPALHMGRIALARGQIAPDLEGRRIGGEHGAAIAAKGFGLGENRRRDGGGGMGGLDADKAHIVIVLRMGGGAADQGGVGATGAQGAKANARLALSLSRRQHCAQGAGHIVVAAKQGHGGVIGETVAQLGEELGRNGLITQGGDKGAELSGQSAHGLAPCACRQARMASTIPAKNSR